MVQTSEFRFALRSGLEADIESDFHHGQNGSHS